MKNTLKWMVVPYDIKYLHNKENKNQILKNTVIPTDVKMKLLNDFINRKNISRNPDKDGMTVTVNNIEKSDNLDDTINSERKTNEFIYNNIKSEKLNINDVEMMDNNSKTVENTDNYIKNEKQNDLYKDVIKSLENNFLKQKKKNVLNELVKQFRKKKETKRLTKKTNDNELLKRKLDLSFNSNEIELPRKLKQK
ncbi:unnamed protein product [Brachionus calyciflorus]|uniref:Uncharacterized protein n=1 Tax=Brachionus calyciflorus TaxID=104777 RepID=A0A813RDS2_9BILA|nr:unnamed protein product [Brachionus calyciflorus]